MLLIPRSTRSFIPRAATRLHRSPPSPPPNTAAAAATILPPHPAVTTPQPTPPSSSSPHPCRHHSRTTNTTITLNPSPLPPPPAPRHHLHHRTNTTTTTATPPRVRVVLLAIDKAASARPLQASRRSGDVVRVCGRAVVSWALVWLSGQLAGQNWQSGEGLVELGSKYLEQVAGIVVGTSSN
ncbi:hypothetical protein Tco_1122608 [Tanacetum coccineum]|uniref:Uncharacterized protein n=1 Tax=Tanacetum coccineum TaxID=301880 RepID=A0ABQ5J3L6_9ASTR